MQTQTYTLEQFRTVVQQDIRELGAELEQELRKRKQLFVTR